MAAENSRGAARALSAARSEPATQDRSPHDRTRGEDCGQQAGIESPAKEQTEAGQLESERQHPEDQPDLVRAFPSWLYPSRFAKYASAAA